MDVGFPGEVRSNEPSRGGRERAWLPARWGQCVMPAALRGRQDRSGGAHQRADLRLDARRRLARLLADRRDQLVRVGPPRIEVLVGDTAEALLQLRLDLLELGLELLPGLRIEHGYLLCSRR